MRLFYVLMVVDSIPRVHACSLVGFECFVVLQVNLDACDCWLVVRDRGAGGLCCLSSSILLLLLVQLMQSNTWHLHGMQACVSQMVHVLSVQDLRGVRGRT